MSQPLHGMTTDEGRIPLAILEMETDEGTERVVVRNRRLLAAISAQEAEFMWRMALDHLDGDEDENSGVIPGQRTASIR